MGKSFLTILFALLLLVAGYFFLPQNTVFDSAQIQSDQLMVISAVPTGEVELGQNDQSLSHISITFNRPMHKLGTPETFDAKKINISPQLDCNWRWLSENTLGCEDIVVKKASLYSIQLMKGIKSLDNKTLEQNFEFDFITSRPRVLRSQTLFEADKIFLELETNQLLDVSSIEANLICDKKQIPLGKPIHDDEKIYYYRIPVEGKSQFSSSEYCELKVKKGLKAIADNGSLRSTHAFVHEFEIPYKVRVMNLPFQLMVIECGGGEYTQGLFDEMINCGADAEIKFVFNRKLAKGVYESVPFDFNIAPEKSLEDDFKPNETAHGLNYIKIHKLFKPNQIYELTFLNDIRSENGEKLKKLGPISFKGQNSPPSFHSEVDQNVKEKNGPWRIPYESKNIAAVKISSLHLADSFELAKLLKIKLKDGTKLFREQIEKDSRFKTQHLNIPFIPNQGEVFPLNLKAINPNPGFFFLKFHQAQVDEQYQNAYIDSIKNYREKYPYYYDKTEPIKPFTVESYGSTLITNIGIHAKVGFFNSLIWVYAIDSGTPLSGVEVRLYNVETLKYETAISDKNGLVELGGRVNLLDTDNWDTEYIITAKKENDISYLTSSYEYQRGLNPWSFNLSYESFKEYDEDILAQIIADRPLYQPGEKVSLKVFLRQWDLESLSLLNLDENEIELKVIDSLGQTVYEKKLLLNDFGTASINFQLKQSAKTGYYDVRLKHVKAKNWNYQIRGFNVQEFRKSNFEVFVTSPVEKLSPSEKTQLKIKAEYMFGGAVKEAEGKLYLRHQTKEFVPKQDEFKNYSFELQNNNHDYSYFYSKTTKLLEKKFKLDKNGVFTHEFELAPDIKYGQFIAEATLKDEHGASIANRLNLPVLTNENFLGVKLDKWSYSLKEKIKPKVILLDSSSSAVKNQEIEIVLIQKIYETVRRLGSGNYYYYDSKVTDKKVASCKVKSAGQATSCQLTPTQAGYYYIIAKTADQEVSTSTYVYGGEGYISWGHFNHDRIDIIPEKNKYQMGETAKFLIKSPYPEAKVLITVERHGILKSEVIDIKTGAYIYELEVDQASYNPGVFLSAVLIQGRTSEKIEGNLDLGKPSFKIGYASIEVQDLDKKLNSVIRLNKAEYKPGEIVKGHIQVKTKSGSNVKSEIAIAVVDQAVLQQVSQYMKTYELYETFYKAPSLSVSNAQILNVLLGRRTYGRKGGTPGGGGGGDSEVRDNFVPLAYWEPHLLTNEEGIAQFEFKAPDNLTKWRVIAVSVDKNHRFGLSDQTFKVNKELMLTPALPNFLTQGDKLDGKFVAFNRTKTDLKVSYQVASSHFDMTKTQGEFLISKDDKKDFVTSMTAAKSGAAQIKASVRSEKFQDTLIYKIPILPVGVEIVESLFLTSEQNKLERNYAFHDDKNITNKKLELLFSTSILQGLDESFSYVIDYPYGCWEQRLSKVLFLAQYQQLKPWLSSFQTEIPIKEEITKLLDIAYKYQTNNGGMKYYPGDANYESRYLSYFTAYAFKLLEDAGYEVDSKVKKSLQNYIQKQVNSDDWDTWWNRMAKENMKSRLLYTLKSYFNADVSKDISSLLYQLDQLSLEAKIYLGRTLKLANNTKELERVTQSILGHIVTKNQFAEITNSSPNYKFMLGTEGKTYCEVVSALMEIKSDLEVIPKLVNKVSIMREKGRWYNTQENILCFKALFDYATLYEKVQPSMRIKAMVGAKEIAQVEFSERTNLVKSKSVDAESIPANGSITFNKQGEGRYYVSMLQKFRTTSPRDLNVAKGFGLSKDLYKFNADKKWEKLEGQIVRLKTGDLIKIILKVRVPSTRYNIGLHDPLAGGLEPVNSALATASQAAIALLEPADQSIKDRFDYFTNFYRSNGFSHMDLRLQAAQFYSDKLDEGDYQVEYMAQVIAKGEFSMNPTKVEEMYYPDNYATTDLRKIIIE